MKIQFYFIILFITTAISFSQNNESVNHRLTVQIVPQTSEITVIDSINIEGDFIKEFC